MTNSSFDYSTFYWDTCVEPSARSASRYLLYPPLFCSLSVFQIKSTWSNCFIYSNQLFHLWLFFIIMESFFFNEDNIFGKKKHNKSARISVIWACNATLKSTLICTRVTKTPKNETQAKKKEKGVTTDWMETFHPHTQQMTTTEIQLRAQPWTNMTNRESRSWIYFNRPSIPTHLRRLIPMGTNSFHLYCKNNLTQYYADDKTTILINRS